MELIKLPIELDFAHNQILLESIILEYESLSQQLLRLVTPHILGPSPLHLPVNHLLLLSTTMVSMDET